MTFRSNIQAMRVGWGVDWWSKWIVPTKLQYKDYLVHDLLLRNYLQLKIKNDNKLKISHMYYYDFFFEKTFYKTKIIIEKYNVDFSWLSQLGFVGWSNKLELGLDQEEDNSFYKSAMLNDNYVNLFFWPQKFFFFYNLFLLKKSVNELSKLNFFSSKFYFKQKNLLSAVNASFFFVDYFFLKQNTFFYKSCFKTFDFIKNNFEKLNLPHNVYAKVPKEISEDWFTLANFLFNPEILKKYPNFVFLYQNWLHNSWIASKKTTLISLKFATVNQNLNTTVLWNVDYFFSWYIRFFFFMRQVNLFFQGTNNSGIGISKEFLEKQKAIFYLWLHIQYIMTSSIWKIWFYFKAYLRYFSYEGRVRVYWSKLAFKWILFLKKFIWIFTTGYKFDLTSFFIILNKLFFLKNKKYIWIYQLITFFLYNYKFMKTWFIFLNKIFYKLIRIFRWILKKWKFKFFWKIKIIYGLFNFFFKKIGFLRKTIGYFVPSVLNSLLLRLTNISLNFELSEILKLKKIPYTLNIFLIQFFFTALWDISLSKKFTYNVIIQNILNLKTNSFNIPVFFSYKKGWYVLKNFFLIEKLLRSTDWLLICLFPPVSIKFFYTFIFFKWKFWFKKFIYFYYYLSNLTVKIFFWIFTDLWYLLNFNLLVHLIVIFWQNFFFFYIFVLKCLRHMYSLCEHDNQLFLSWPVKLFLQKNNMETTIIDFFSSSFQSFGSFLPIPFKNNLNPERSGFTLIDFATGLANLGKPNNWMLLTTKHFLPFNKFTLMDTVTDSPVYAPYFNFFLSNSFFFKKKGEFFFDKKFRFNINYPFFKGRNPTHLKVKYFSNLHLTANLIATFIKKKLEKEHLIVEILRSLNLLLKQASSIWGFMFLLKGRFSWWERASKIWLKKGKLGQTDFYKNIDYCKLPAWLKYGTASVWVWLLIEVPLDDKHSFV